MLYIVKAGDSLSIIAKKFGQPYSSWKQIYQANPQIGSNPDKIYPGQILTIPSSWDSGSQQEKIPEEQQIKKADSPNFMNWVYISGGLFLLYLAYKKRSKK